MKAVYLVLFKLEEKKKIEIGALGRMTFAPGIYGYVGSAMNSVESRLERHFSDPENLHWHIDYFSRVAEPLDYFILPESSRYECVLSEIGENLGEPIQGFGASDCNCGSHLYRFI